MGLLMNDAVRRGLLSEEILKAEGGVWSAGKPFRR
jgi:hypothetical protein